MKKEFKASYRFEIVQPKNFEEYLKIDWGSYSIGTKAVSSRKYFRKKIFENNGRLDLFDDLASVTGKNIDDNRSKYNIQSLKNIHSILCWLFYENSGQNHDISHVRDFLKNLKIINDSEVLEASLSFEKFISLIHPYLSESFKHYNYILNIDSKEFEVIDKNKVDLKDKSSILTNDGANKKDNTKSVTINAENVFIKHKNIIEKITDHGYFKKVLLSLGILAVLFLCLIGLNTYWISENLENEKSEKFEDVTDCYFKSDSTKQNILILPFKDISGKDAREDSGWIITQRLDSLNKADSLGLKIKFCNKLNPKQDNVTYFEELKTQFGANHIIYGFYDQISSSCNTGEKKDKVCLNYITNFNTKIFTKVPNKYTKNSYGNFKLTSLTDLNKGYLQENIDFLIYYNALISAYNKYKFNKALEYSNKLLSKSTQSSKAIVHLLRGYIYQNMYKDDLAIKEHLKSLEFNSKSKSTAHAMIGKIYATYNKNKRARYHFLQAFKNINLQKLIKDRNSSVYFFYKVNSALGKHIDNLQFFSLLGNIDSDYQQDFLYLSLLARKEITNYEGFKKDSTKIYTDAKRLKRKVMPSTPNSVVGKRNFATMFMICNRYGQYKANSNQEADKKVEEAMNDLSRIKAFSDGNYDKANAILKNTTFSIQLNNSFYMLKPSLEQCNDIWSEIFQLDSSFVADEKPFY